MEKSVCALSILDSRCCCAYLGRYVRSQAWKAVPFTDTELSTNVFGMSTLNHFT